MSDFGRDVCPQEPLQPALRGEEGVLLKPRHGRLVVRNELERDVEAAGADEFDERFETWRDGTLLPARDDRPIAAAPFCQFVLGQAGPQPRLTDQIAAPHRAHSSQL
jgi:hypothetical protein